MADMTFNSVRSVFLSSLLLSLVACGQPTPTSVVTSTESQTAAEVASSTPEVASVMRGEIGGLSAQAVAPSTSLTLGQTQQFTVYVSGQPAQPGQLVWTSTNSAVASVTSTGLVTARAAGSATVRAALASYPAAFIDFPIVVSGTATTPPPAPSNPNSSFAQRVLELTNKARAQARTCGGSSYAAAAPLAYNARLETAAQGHATDMATKNYFSHTSQDGRSFAQRITAAGYTWTRAAENIAAGYATPETVVAGWLASAGHCANIMSPTLREMGVGYAYNAGSSYRSYWVQDFGTR